MSFFLGSQHRGPPRATVSNRSPMSLDGNHPDRRELFPRFPAPGPPSGGRYVASGASEHRDVGGVGARAPRALPWGVVGTGGEGGIPWGRWGRWGEWGSVARAPWALSWGVGGTGVGGGHPYIYMTFKLFPKFQQFEPRCSSTHNGLF